MEENTNKLIQDQLNTLPENARKALLLVNWKEKLRRIAESENLSSEQADKLENETMFILYGFLSPDNYLDNIMKEVGLDNVQAQEIVEIVNNEIIAAIDKQLEKLESPASQNKNLESDKHVTSTSTAIEIPPEILPMVEEGETVHDTPPEAVMPKESPIEIKPEAPIPSITIDKAEEKAAETAPQETPIRKSAYPGGIDPYREPIE